MVSSLVWNLQGIAPEVWHSDANSEAQVRVLFSTQVSKTIQLKLLL
jgi:hypothetical protein